MRSLLLVLFAASSGCGIALQSAVGWTSIETAERAETREVAINTVPPTATVCRQGVDLRCRDVGRAPFTDTLDVRVEAEVETPSTAGLWVGTGMELGVAVIAIVAAPSRCSDGSGNCPAGVFITAAAGIVFGVVDMMAAVLYPAFSTEEVASRRVLDRPTATYGARKDGYAPTEETITVGVQDELVLRLTPLDDSTTVALVDAAKGNMIVAVMPVSSETPLAWHDELMRRLRIDLTGTGIRTIEPATQAAAIAACVGEDCHLEVGRALAASHVLRSRVTQLGERCVLAAELVDIARAVTVSAVGARATCDDQAVVDKLGRDLARDLLIGFRTGTSAP